MISPAKNNTALSVFDLLIDFTNRKTNGFLVVSANGVSWFTYFHEGRIFYGNFSIDPLERLERYVGQVLKSRQGSVDSNIFERLRRDTAGFNLESYYPSYDYQSLYSLFTQNYLTEIDFSFIVRKITKESMRSLLLLADFKYEFVADNRQFPLQWSIEFCSLSQECYSEITDWQELRSPILSPYQRPYLFTGHQSQGKYRYLEKFLVGLDFNHLALHLNQPAINIAQNLDLLIAYEIVGLDSPNSQYAKLPEFSRATKTAELALLKY